jgi:hypothetical protein
MTLYQGLIGVALEPLSSTSRSYGVAPGASGELQPRRSQLNAERIVQGIKTWVVAAHVYIAATEGERNPRTAGELRARHSRAAVREANAVVAHGNGQITLDGSATGSGSSNFIESNLSYLVGRGHVPVFIGVDRLGHRPFSLATARSNTGGHSHGFTYPATRIGRLDAVVVMIAGGNRRTGPGSDPHHAVQEAEAIAHELVLHAARLLRRRAWEHGDRDVERVNRLLRRIRDLIQDLFFPGDRQEYLGALSASRIETLIDDAIRHLGSSSHVVHQPGRSPR